MPSDKGDRERTISYKILRAHDRGNAKDRFSIGFDAMISHDITYVGIIQTARASGMKEFPIPYALTNCHNSLCAVGGTINEDDHAFGLSAAKKYGGIYVPANQAVIHQYAREMLTGCGKMILGSDSHTRYGCYGTLGVGEGGGELAKQLLRDTWDIDAPEVVLVWLEGTPPHGVGPHDVAIALVGETFPGGKVKNKILEFAGPGVANLSMDFRIGIDVMTTETSCLTSVWETDEKVKEFYETVGRGREYRKLSVEDGAGYDAMVEIDLGSMESMIALPFHPSRAYTVHQLQAEPERILSETQDECNNELGDGVKLDLLRSIGEDGKVHCEQGVIVGCSGGMYENIREAADIIEGKSVGDGYFDLSVYPSSSPIGLALIKDGTAAKLVEAGAVVKPAFCGPCFGAGDTPAHNTLSIRHATRNFANREGSKPSGEQIAAVALMDARSIAATAINGGVLTAATDVDYEVKPEKYVFDKGIYEKRCYNGFGKAEPDYELRLGPNITDWPVMPEMRDDLLLNICAVIPDPVTTTDELIPSGETSSYRSNPVALSEFALSRRVPEYVGRSKAVRDGQVSPAEVIKLLDADSERVSVGSAIYAVKPGDGSAREQAASCQKVLGGWGNICREYATKRYRSNCINWGIVPFTCELGAEAFSDGDWLYVPGVREGILEGRTEFSGKLVSGDTVKDIKLGCGGLTENEREILTAGCLMNWYKLKNKA
ncbi:MAG: hydratase [Oscillospiraceae bacterium]|nr:hydratase [Oscillospiraceae bacterium]